MANGKTAGDDNNKRNRIEKCDNKMIKNPMTFLYCYYIYIYIYITIYICMLTKTKGKQ